MVFLTRKILHLFSQHEKKNIKVNHCMKISGIIKWMYRYNDLNKDVLDNMNIQIINSINYIDPNKIINNLIINKNKEINIEKKKNYYLKSLKKKIVFNSLLLKTIYCKKNFFFQLYEYNNGKKCIYDNNKHNNNINMVKNNNTREYFDVTKTIINNNTTDKSENNLFNNDNNNFPLINNNNMLGRNLKRKKKNLFLNNKNVIFKKKNSQIFNEEIINTISSDTKDDLKKKSRFNLDTLLYDNNNKNNIIINYKYDHIYDNFKLFDLSYNYNSFLLNNILKNICTYIYHFKFLNKINNEQNNGYEYISLILISKIFHYFYELNYGYKYMIHFLNGLSVFKIKKEINLENLSYEYIKSHINNKDHYNYCHDHLFEKEICISSIINYLCEYDTGTKQERNNINEKNEHVEKKKEKKNCIYHVNNTSSYNTINNNDKNSFIHTFVSHDKKKTYIINMKEKLLLHYNIDESFLNYFLNILGEKYNIEKLPFISYSFLMHMYSMSNHFIVHFFSLCPLLFVKNKIHADISIYIILLNSCVFFLCSKSYMTSFSSFIINTKNEGENHLVYKENKLIQDGNLSTQRKNEISDEHRKIFQDTDNVNIVKEKIYSFIEQIINYLYINKDILNNNQLLHILEIFSFIKYNKAMFTYIINTLTNSLSILDKYETIYLLHSLSNYNSIYNDIKNNIYKEALKIYVCIDYYVFIYKERKNHHNISLF
ncbi:hypothetical protein PFNF135_03611 [Plasmodium falciparum NF135/5.C10]|uniref:Uncharacterized protein n=1 Tax=Plasmodium falciparum NF135/5.C10 TaxID=1036726 RepID=W4IEK4_PLAFA|nr:hypothetical protein PFNF135_03611 [Plasmodium falciparum NF135/5.C10]